MTMKLQDRIVHFWMDIIPELQNEESKLNNHLKKYLSIDIDQAIQSYSDYEILNIDEKLETIHAKEENVKGVKEQLFSGFFQQFIFFYQDRLSSIIQNTELISNAHHFETTLNSILYRKLFAEGYLVLIKELNLYRENQLLEADSEEEQFNYFCSEIIISKEFFHTLNTEYPTFLRRLFEIVENTLNYVEEVIVNTERDVQKLENYFSLKINKSLNEIQFIGDLHNGGKSVCALKFETGKLIYKPKNLEMESKFQELLKHINSQIPDSTFYEMKVFSNDTHGWCEFITHEKCKTVEEAKRCSKRFGKLLALLYSLNGVDFHYENVIFNGDNPVLVDLETLFSVPLKDSLSTSQSAFIKASRRLRNSVLSVGLLPTKMKISENNAVGIGVLDEVQTYEVTIPSIINPSSSIMKVRMKKKQIQTGQNSFIDESNNQLNLDLVSYIKEGFTEIYQWIMNDKAVFVNLVLKLFKDCQVRIIAKPTMVYSQLISAANHPDFLTRAIHQKIVFSRVGLISENDLIAKSEIKQLERNDIPYFVADFHKKHLYTYSSQEITDALFDSPRENFRKKISFFSESDLKSQLDYINESFFKKDAEKEIPPINIEGESNPHIKIDDYYALALRIGELLKRQAIFGENDNKETDVIWLDTSVSNMDIDDWTPEVTSYDLYNGLSGLAIFFMNLDRVSQSNANHEIIQIIVNMLKNYITSPNLKKDNIQSGIMTGLSGMFLTIFEYAHLYQSKAEKEFVEKNIIKLQEIIIGNNPIDYVAGNVGALSLMTRIMQKTNNEKLKEKCKHIADQIILYFKHQNTDLFELNKSDTTIYSGFSHGLSGLINYLYEYYTLTNDLTVYHLFKECLDYQRLNFWCTEELDWYVSNKEQRFAYGWCHGSPGILLEKVNLKKLGYIDEILDKEIVYASSKIIDNLGTNISLCHGDLGNILIYNKYADFEKNEKAKTIVNNAIGDIYRFTKLNLESDSKMSFKQFKGLMLGIAGVGDFMLKAYVDSNQELIEYLW